MRAEEVEAWPRVAASLRAGAGRPARGRSRRDSIAAPARAAQARVEQRDLTGVRTEINELLKAARAAGDRVAAARALTVLADCEQKEGNLIGSDATYEQAVAEWRALDDDQGLANALRGRGMTLMFRGELDDSEAAIQQALSTFRGIPERRGEAWALQNLAWIAFTRGRPDEAEERINQSAAVFAEIGDWGGLSWALGLLAWVRFNQGQLAEAEQLAVRRPPRRLGIGGPLGERDDGRAARERRDVDAAARPWRSNGRVRRASCSRRSATSGAKCMSIAPAARALGCSGPDRRSGGAARRGRDLHRRARRPRLGRHSRLGGRCARRAPRRRRTGAARVPDRDRRLDRRAEHRHPRVSASA